MIVYHGSNSNFKKLRISKALVQHESTLLNEGIGIYFSTDKKVAESYGKYLYILEINDKQFIDYRVKRNCTNCIQKLLRAVYKEAGVNVGIYFDIQNFIDRMYTGGQAIYTIGKDIAEILDNTSEFYCDFSQSRRDRIYRALRRSDRERAKVYMFNYHIPNIGVIKDVSESTVRIVTKESNGIRLG